MDYYNIDFSKFKAFKQIKNYRLINVLLGKGVSGEVYLA